MTESYDLIVLGGGPAGASAAIEAVSHGLRTLLIDEGRDAGGQVFRPLSPAIAAVPASADQAEGDALRERLAASGVVCRFGRRVWMVEPGFRVASLGPAGPEEALADALVVATGAVERHVPVPGWTLPGVIGLGAATVLLKSEKMLPGRRVVVAGAGPLLLLVAAAILAGGGEVVAVVDQSRRRALLRTLPALVGRPDLAWHGLKWLRRIRAHRVPVLRGYAVSQIGGTDAVERVTCRRIDAGGRPLVGRERHFQADAVCLGFGLLPSSEITQLLGATHRFDEIGDGWVVATGADGRTDVPRLYGCGDGAGVAGAAAAPPSGRVAALAAAHDLGRIDAAAFAHAAAPLQRDLVRARRFGAAMTALSRPADGLLDLMTDDTILCRCEGLTRGTLQRAIDAGSASLNDLKAATRCGMGPCGGRTCAAPAAALLAAATGRKRAEIRPFTTRPPLRPVPLGLLAAEFSYADLPHLPPGPL